MIESGISPVIDAAVRLVEEKVIQVTDHFLCIILNLYMFL